MFLKQVFILSAKCAFKNVLVFGFVFQRIFGWFPGGFSKRFATTLHCNLYVTFVPPIYIERGHYSYIGCTKIAPSCDNLCDRGEMFSELPLPMCL